MAADGRWANRMAAGTALMNFRRFINSSKSSTRHGVSTIAAVRKTARTAQSLFALEVAQVGRRLVFAGRHQQSVPADEIMLVADEDLQIAFGTDVFRPLRILIPSADISLVDGPWSRGRVVDD